MENNQYHKLFKRSVLLSVAFYAISFLLPVFSTTDDKEIHFMQGTWMLLWGWLGEHGLCLIWLANPIYITLICMIRVKLFHGEKIVTTRTMRVFSYLTVILGFAFFLKGEMILDEGGCVHPITAFHIGYWAWEASMILLAVALMAKSEEVTTAHRIISWFLSKTDTMNKTLKVLTPILLAILLECVALNPFPISQKDSPFGTKRFSGYYKTCQKISVNFISNDKVLATISSTDFVGNFSTTDNGQYTYKPPYVLIQWENYMVDMNYMMYDTLSHRMIIFGAEDTYYLEQDATEPQRNISSHWFKYNERVVLPDNDYYIVERDTLINRYGTDAQQLRLPEGYHLTYDQILERQIQKLGGLDEDGQLFPLYNKEDKALLYEDDSLLIVFSRLCILTESPNHPIGIKDYSAVPMIVYDKRKKRL